MEARSARRSSGGGTAGDGCTAGPGASPCRHHESAVRVERRRGSVPGGGATSPTLLTAASWLPRSHRAHQVPTNPPAAPLSLCPSRRSLGYLDWPRWEERRQLAWIDGWIAVSVARIRPETHVSGVRYVRIRGYLRILRDTYPVRIQRFFIFRKKKSNRILLGYGHDTEGIRDYPNPSIETHDPFISPPELGVARGRHTADERRVNAGQLPF